MAEALTFFEQHGVLVLFFVTLLDQLGLPLPSSPLVLAAGAMALSSVLVVSNALRLRRFAPPVVAVAT